MRRKRIEKLNTLLTAYNYKAEKRVDYRKEEGMYYYYDGRVLLAKVPKLPMLEDEQVC